MTALMIVVMFAGFVLLDVAVRQLMRRWAEARVQQERRDALDAPMRIGVMPEAPTLKRVEVDKPSARVLAVDDEPVVLASLRKILVLGGHSVDTVESGPEALGLVQRRDYDIVFVDLKMPGMDGIEVVKAVKQVRPDIDVVVITGYGAIESAVATMRHGAVEYLQKPIDGRVLSEIVRKLLLRRDARLSAQRRFTVHVVAPAAADFASECAYSVPGGAFLSDGHVWARIEIDGSVRVGLDDFARKALKTIDAVTLPGHGSQVQRNETLFTLWRGGASARLAAPLDGIVREVHQDLERRPGLLVESPYDRGWVCLLQPSRLSEDLARLRIGQSAVSWYQDEIDRLHVSAGRAVAPIVDWPVFERQFLQIPR